MVFEKGYTLLLNLYSLLHSTCEILLVSIVAKSLISYGHSENFLLDDSCVTVLCHTVCFSWLYILGCTPVCTIHKTFHSDLEFRVCSGMWLLNYFT